MTTRALRLPSPGHRVGLVLIAVLATGLCGGSARAQWVEPPGSGWVQLALFHLDTTEEFGPDGERRELFADGHIVSTSLFVTAAAGIVPGVDVWGQIPLHRLTFEDAASDLRETGLGDPRLWVRAGPGALGLGHPGPVRIAVRGGVKLQGGEFPVDPDIIPLTEGQRDWELLVEAGASFWPTPLYAYGWVGRRWREENEAALKDPGDETFAYAAVGGSVGALTWELAGEGLWGGPWVIEGVRTGTASRRLVQLLPRAGWPAGPGRIEVGGRIPLDGRNLPAGAALTAGYFFDWSL